MGKNLLLIVASIFLFCNCANYKNIDVTDAELTSVKMTSVAKYNVAASFEVYNPSGTKFTLRDCSGVILKGGVPFADVVMMEEVVVPSRGTYNVEVKGAISLRDPLGALIMGLNFKSLDMSQFTVNLSGTVKGGAIKKKIEIKDMPLKRLYNYVK